MITYEGWVSEMRIWSILLMIDDLGKKGPNFVHF